jgi:hypothetical protein
MDTLLLVLLDLDVVKIGYSFLILFVILSVIVGDSGAEMFTENER